MARPKHKAPKGKPITQHHLFPAVVALWFSALFGLGSLAIRPSLLEDLVIRSGIDLLVPAAAPPLGMTARMLLALAMAALGAMLGTMIARLIARPRPEVRARKRTRLSTRDEGAEKRDRHGLGNDHARLAGSADEEPCEGAAAVSRRRSLAIEHEERDFVPREPAPLPGGSPQIFDIASAGLDNTLTGEAGAHEAVSEVEPTHAALDWTNAAPVSAQAMETQRQLFRPDEPATQSPPPAVSQDGRQVFGMTPPSSPPPQLPRQVFGAQAADDHVSADCDEAPGPGTSLFHTPAPEPLFAPRVEAAPVPVESLATTAVALDPEVPAPSPASLGLEDLSARLVESMRRRRAARAAAPAASAPEPAPQASAAPASSIEADAPVAALPEAPSRPDAIPAAMRPLDLSGFEEDHDLDTLLPPRRIVMPSAPSPVAEAEAVSPAAFAAAPGALEDEPDSQEETAVAENGYASLLGLAPVADTPRNPFVRIEEPETVGEQIEPVVIFPGQIAHPPAPPLAAAAEGGEEAMPFRRFDAPANAGQGQPVAAAGAASAIPPDEAERALRAALASLQRMSGAA